MPETEPQPPQSSPRHGVLYFVVAWRSILVLTSAVVVAAAVAAFLAWPFWEFERASVTIVERAPTVADAELDKRNKEIEALRTREAELHRALQQRKDQCTSCRPPPTPTPTGRPSPTAEPAPHPKQPPARTQLDCDTICRLREDVRKTMRGSVSISLIWNSIADLDLFIICPDGTMISYKKRQTCSGKLNQDINSGGSRTDRPAENITLTEDSPAGVYRVEVSYFDPRGQGPVMPFTVKLVINGEEKTFTGTAVFPSNKDPNRIAVASFTLQPRQSRPPAPPNDRIDADRRRCNCAQRLQGSQ